MRSLAVGKPQYSSLSRRPGRSSAASNMSGRDVAPITTTPAIHMHVINLLHHKHVQRLFDAGNNPAKFHNQQNLRDSGRMSSRNGKFTFQTLHAVQLSQQLVDNAIGDPSRVVASLRRNGVKLIKEQDARRRSTRSPAHASDFPKLFFQHCQRCNLCLARPLHACPQVVPMMHLMPRRLSSIQQSICNRGCTSEQARLNRSRTAASLAPMYLLRTSGPLTLTKRMPAAATAAATVCVLPHPGGPYSSTPVRSRRGALR